ncbi:tyrosine-type recombinase/integrase [Wenyingzhuangia aestuarii]|uniref:tyrosine-type recombinase/integrase n=1 Tax=Wenyingzhuangia aestuarii TaxID=1647582 RepID=UPI00143A94B1|nr:tyrosine-type recombinase/integrase [Wenyingzhuangia aestuarii]NJB82049.1 integrase [Wenyingzhuangia aestuarii]
MKHTFFLKHPKSDKETLILFSCYFKNERKKLVYSTRETIHPSQWDFENNQPIKKGKNRSLYSSNIKSKLDRFSTCFEQTITFCNQSKINITSSYIKEQLDIEFNVISQTKSFFNTYDEFTEEQIKRQLWQEATIKRYQNIKNILSEFQEKRKYNLNFNTINSRFLSEFTDFCYVYRKHSTNTFSRNLGLFITFLNWSLKNKHTFNAEFKNFKKPQRVLTRQEALTKEDIEKIYNHKFDSKKHEITKDLFIIQCLTGVRYEDVHRIGRANTFEEYIMVKDGKDPTKSERSIPLLPITKEILIKYDYKLPERSNQKQNDYIKEILKELGFTREVEYTVAKGSKHIKYTKPFYKRITTHTARRSYITIMRNHGIADKTIMSLSGHKDIRTFNMYHQVDDKARIDAVNSVFG